MTLFLFKGIVESTIIHSPSDFKHVYSQKSYFYSVIFIVKSLFHYKVKEYSAECKIKQAPEHSAQEKLNRCLLITLNSLFFKIEL